MFKRKVTKIKNDKEEEIKSIIRFIIKIITPELFRIIKLNRYMKNNLPVEFINHINFLTKDHLVIDVGANIGIVSECLAKKGSKVISFEPNHEAFIELKKVATKYSNIEAKFAAVGTKDKNVKLYMHKQTNSSKEDLTQASSLLAKKPNISTEIYKEVKQIDFAEFLKALKIKVELIKIDIEGYEIELINHLLDQNSLENVKKIYLETHEEKIKELIEPTKKLKKRIKSEGFEEKFCFDWP